MTIERLKKEVNEFREMVPTAGRDPEQMLMPLRVHNVLSDDKVADPRPLLSGTPRQAADDLLKIRDLGINHVYYDMNYPAAVPLDVQLRLLGRMVELAAEN